MGGGRGPSLGTSPAEGLGIPPSAARIARIRGKTGKQDGRSRKKGNRGGRRGRRGEEKAKKGWRGRGLGLFPGVWGIRLDGAKE